jgi:hypothetical protein
MENQKLVARSHLFIGRNGQGSQKRRPYSCLRIDVKGDCPRGSGKANRNPKFIIRPLVAEWYQRLWHNYEIEPFTI